MTPFDVLRLPCLETWVVRLLTQLDMPRLPGTVKRRSTTCFGEAGSCDPKSLQLSLRLDGMESTDDQLHDHQATLSRSRSRSRSIVELWEVYTSRVIHCARLIRVASKKRIEIFRWETPIQILSWPNAGRKRPHGNL